MKRVAPIYADDSDWNLLLEGDREWASQSLNSVPALPLPQEVEILESNHPVADDGPDGGGVEFVDSVFHELVLPPISNFRTLSAPAPSLPRREEASTTNPAPAAAPPFLSSEHIDASPPVLQEKELDQISETSDSSCLLPSLFKQFILIFSGNDMLPSLPPGVPIEIQAYATLSISFR